MPASLVLDHVGYAVNSLAEYLRDFVPLLHPAEIGPAITDPLQQVRVQFVTLADGNRIELIEPLSDKSPVIRVLQQGHGGLYHVCFRTPSLTTEVESFIAKGCMLVRQPTPAAAFDGRRIAFLLTPQTDLIELVETAPLPGRIA